jgi:hypothetical protein
MDHFFLSPDLLEHLTQKTIKSDLREKECHTAQLAVCFLLGLFFDPKDEGTLFFLNITGRVPDYRHYIPEVL